MERMNLAGLMWGRPTGNLLRQSENIWGLILENNNNKWVKLSIGYLSDLCVLSV